MKSDEQFDALRDVRLRASVGDPAIFSGQYIARLLQHLELAEAERVVNELLRLYRELVQAEGSWDLLEHTPPMVIPRESYADIPRVMHLLFPQSTQGYPVPPPRGGFFEWQTEVVQRARAQVKPTRKEARSRWLAKCRSDPKWQTAVSRVRSGAAAYVARRENPRVLARWGTDSLTNRLFDARLGVTKCSHTSVVPSCLRCPDYIESAAYAHLGWRDAPWKRAGQPSEKVRETIERCACCLRKHIWRGTGKPRCLYCAEAALTSDVEIESRRWGGWHWLRQSMLDEAWPENYTAAALKAPPTNPRVGYSPFAGRIPAFGGREAVATFILPVPWFRDDTKLDLSNRATALIDALWKVGGISHSRSTGTSDARSADLNRRLTWLWETRVQGLPVERVTEAESRGIDTATMDSRSIRRAIRKAVSELQD